MSRISADRARRLALAAQGFADPRPSGRVDVRHFRRVLDRVSLVQLDSVNVFSRTHYMPFFSRLGPYDRSALDAWLWESGELFEYWGHEASLIPIEQHPLFRPRMNGDFRWDRLEAMRRDNPDYLWAVLEEVREKGPVTTSHLDAPGERIKGQMWGWSDGKVALEALFMGGYVTTAGRPNFIRHYDVVERVIPSHILEVEVPDPDVARRRLLLHAARSLGVATLADLADYHRMGVPRARPLLKDLVANGLLEQVEVDGWSQPAYLHPEIPAPRRIEGSALLSPFDSLVWFRQRTERIFGFHYRIEIYVPAPKRVYGYYVLPYLMDGRLVARVDLKTDRQAGRLRVQGAFAEDGMDRAAIGNRLAADLRLTAQWLGMAEVEVMPNGDLAGSIAAAV